MKLSSCGRGPKTNGPTKIKRSAKLRPKSWRSHRWSYHHVDRVLKPTDLLRLQGQWKLRPETWRPHRWSYHPMDEALKRKDLQWWQSSRPKLKKLTVLRDWRPLNGATKAVNRRSPSWRGLEKTRLKIQQETRKTNKIRRLGTMSCRRRLPTVQRTNAFQADGNFFQNFV